ncbi:arginine N-succinyltransferase [Psychrobium sp. nBUS_13]|uniref:arginine N-succinyltransferase n=1 Tax=Psychrobium sp. nBUS_13 TaxID=3395319 RepID=UPI003EBDD88B
MLVIRPIVAADYPALMQIAHDSGVGFTSLPTNEQLLRSRIAHSEESFAANATQPGTEGYLMVMEDTETGKVVGTSGIESAVGLDNAFYHYHLGKVVHSSQELKLHNTIDTLTLCNDYTGAAELCTLFLSQDARGGNNGRVLSRCRFLMLAEFGERFGDKVIAEMRGVSDESGNSPFWEWLEAHFFSMDFPTADYLSGIGNKVFIAELMPRYPIYTNLLSQEAQDVIGRVHEKTRPALRLLEREGFRYRGYVDIFDAGPTVECEREQINAVRGCVRVTVKISDVEEGSPFVACNTDFEHFRATEVHINLCENQEFAFITQEHANALNVTDGDKIRVVAL